MSSYQTRDSLLERLDRWLQKPRERAAHRPAGTARDVADAERRLQARERALLQRYY